MKDDIQPGELGMTRAVVQLIHSLAEIALVAVTVFLLWHVAQSVVPTEIAIESLSSATQKTLANIDKEIPRLQASVASTAASVNATSEQVNGLVAEIHSQVPGIGSQAKLDLQEAHNLILESSLTAMEARKASAEERAALPQMTASAKQSLDALHGELAELQTTTRDLDTLINDPANKKTLNSLSDGTAALAATAQDGQKYVHGLLHPTWPHKVWGVVLDVAHVFNPL